MAGGAVGGAVTFRNGAVGAVWHVDSRGVVDSLQTVCLTLV